MQEISKGFNGILKHKGKLKHKIEIRVELYSLGFYLFEYGDGKLLNQTPRSTINSANTFLLSIRLKYRELGYTIYELEDTIKFNYNKKTLLYEDLNK